MAGVTFSFLIDGAEVQLPVTPSRYRWGAGQAVNSIVFIR